MGKMSRAQMEKKFAYLEFVNDQLMSEIRYVDALLRSIGFPDGLETVKLAAQELKERENETPSQE